MRILPSSCCVVPTTDTCEFDLGVLSGELPSLAQATIIGGCTVKEARTFPRVSRFLLSFSMGGRSLPLDSVSQPSFATSNV
jgi:hypothetical protein